MMGASPVFLCTLIAMAVGPSLSVYPTGYAPIGHNLGHGLVSRHGLAPNYGPGIPLGAVHGLHGGLHNRRYKLGRKYGRYRKYGGYRKYDRFTPAGTYSKTTYFLKKLKAKGKAILAQKQLAKHAHHEAHYLLGKHALYGSLAAAAAAKASALSYGYGGPHAAGLLTGGYGGHAPHGGGQYSPHGGYGDYTGLVH